MIASIASEGAVDRGTGADELFAELLPTGRLELSSAVFGRRAIP